MTKFVQYLMKNFLYIEKASFSYHGLPSWTVMATLHDLIQLLFFQGGFQYFCQLNFM